MRTEPRLLDQPVSFFSTAPERYRSVYRLQYTAASPVFWEMDCLFARVSGGSGTLMVNQVACPVRQGDVCMLHSFHVFSFLPAENETLSIEVVLYPYPSMVLLTMGGGEQEGFNPSQVVYSLSPEQSQEYDELIETLEEEFHREPRVQSICSFLLGQLDCLIREGKARNITTLPLCTRVFYDVALSSFHAPDPESFAVLHGLSSRQLNQELRKVCLQDYRAVLNHARLSNAYSMMLRDNLSVSAWGLDAGFASEASFYRVFRDYFGKSPNEYRLELQQLLNLNEPEPTENILAIESFLLNRFRDDISCEDCAGALYLSQDAINQALRARYGSQASFTVYLNTLRLKYAAGLLSMTDVPIIDVALDSGFNSVHTFIRQFKKQYQCTPTAFRKKQRTEEI